MNAATKYNKESVFFALSFLSAAVLLTTAVVRAKSQAATTPQHPSFALPAATKPQDVIGNPPADDTMATLVEFADYQCPPCQYTARELHAWLPTVQGKVRFVFRNFPLSIHDHAYTAAIAAEAAREQGKFDAMHDLLYAHQGHLTTPDIDGYAASLHLDMTAFHKSCSSSAKARVNSDIRAAQKLGVNATPTLLLCDTDGAVRPTNLDALNKKYWLSSLRHRLGK